MSTVINVTAAQHILEIVTKAPCAVRSRSREDVKLRAFIAPTLRAVDTDFNEVAACAAAQVKARHASGLRRGTIAAGPNFGEDALERRIFGDAARVAFIDCRT